MKKGNTKKDHTLGKAMLSAAILASVMATPSVIAEAAPNNTQSLGEDATNQNMKQKVSPDKPIVFELPLNKDNLKSLNLDYKKGELVPQNKNKKEQVGVYVQNNNKQQLATQENKQLTITTDGTTLFLETNVEGGLEANSTASATVLMGSALNKYNAQVNSNGNSKAFSKFMESLSGDDTLQQTVQVGSEVGVATDIKVSRPEGVIMTQDGGAVIEFTATDDYGNPATRGAVTFEGAHDLFGNPVEGITVDNTAVEFVDGQAKVTVQSDKTQLVVVEFEVDNDAGEVQEYQVPIQFIKTVESGSEIDLRYEENADGSVTVEGVVEKDGIPQADVGVPILVENGKPNDTLPITDEDGKFTVIIEDVTSDTFPEVSVDETIAPGIEIEESFGSPVLSGSSEWIQTRIIITEPNTLIQINAIEGEWGEDLYAKVGENGTPVKVGAGGFVTGTTGNLYLGSYNELHDTDLKASVTLNNPDELGLTKVFTFASDKKELAAGSTSSTTVRGSVHYGEFALVDGQVELATTFGSLGVESVTTDANGDFITTFRAGTAAGTAQVTAQLDDIVKDETITVKKASNLKVDLNYFRAYNQGVEYSLDEGKTWKQVWIFNSFHDVVWDEANQQLIGYGHSARIWYSTDGLKWTSSYNKSTTTFDGIKGMIVSDDGVAIAIRGTFNSNRPTTTYLDGSRYKEDIRFLKSTNGGRTWTEVFHGNNHETSRYRANDDFTSATYEDGKFIIELKPGQFVTSNDGGKFWKDEATGDFWHSVSYRIPGSDTVSYVRKPTELQDLKYEDGIYTTSSVIDGTLRSLTSTNATVWTDTETNESYRYGTTVTKSGTNSYRIINGFTKI